MQKETKKAHTSSNILTQKLENDPKLEDNVEIFFNLLDVPETLKSWGCLKHSGLPTERVLHDILLLSLARVSVENNAAIGKVPTEISKDQFYRFLEIESSDWLRINSEMAFKTIAFFNPDYTSDSEAKGIFIVDDTPFKRPYSKKTEMLSTQFDHAEHEYYIGGRLSLLGYVYNGDYITINNALITSADSEKYYSPPKPVKEGSPAEERRKLAASKLTEVPFKQIKIAKEAGIKGDHVAFDSWFSSPKVLLNAKKDALDSIARLKTNTKTKYLYRGEEMTLQEIYESNRYTLPPEGEDERLFTVLVEVEHEGEYLPLKIVFCESYDNSNNPFVAIASTDVDLSDKTIVRLYRLRWKEEVINKEVKSAELNLLKGNRCMNLDSICAYISIVQILWLLSFFFAKVNGQGDSIRRSFLRVGVHSDNVRVINALLGSLNQVIKDLELKTKLDRSQLITIITSSILESKAFEFYLTNLPLDMC